MKGEEVVDYTKRCMTGSLKPKANGHQETILRHMTGEDVKWANLQEEDSLKSQVQIMISKVKQN